jgi:hypothetical protein
MAKGFMTPKELRAERNASCTDFITTVQWAIVHKPGAVPINGGRSRRISDFTATGYRLAVQRARKYNKRITKTSRYTPPRRRRVERKAEDK